MKKLKIAQAKKISESEFIFLGIPTDIGAASARKGRILAPDKVRYLSEDWFIPFSGKVNPKNIFDYGNIRQGKDILKNLDTIENEISKLFAQNKKIVTIGGDCSIKYGILRGINRLKKKFSVVYIDSHPDLMMKDMPYYGSVLNDSMALKNFDLKNSVLVGIREIEPDEHDIIEKKNILHFTPMDFKRFTIDAIFEKIKKSIPKNNLLYLSLDIDAVDPSMAPAVGCIAPGGLTSNEILYLMNKLKTLNPIGLDITEFIPKFDINDITGKLIYRIINDFMAK